MTHNFNRGSAVEEALFSLGTGALFGCTNTLVGHPLDTIKTVMQTMTSKSILGTARHIFVNNGISGFYRGCIPPMWGSVVYRSCQFSVFEAMYTLLGDNKSMITSYGYFGLEPRVVIAGLTASTARSIIEAPIEYAKVQGQTGQVWRFSDLYRGAHLQWLRTGPMMTFYFISVDTLRRKTNLMSTTWGQFLISGGSAAVGFILVWPFETLKNRTQAGVDSKGSSMWDNMKRTGITGLYRGIVPGVASVFLRNGAAMLVMQKAQKSIREWREKNGHSIEKQG